MKKLISFFLIIVFLCIFFFSQNNVIQISKYELTSDKISTDLKILQISDLHSKSFGNNQEKLVEKIKNINPDFIVFTGDSFDANRSTSQKDLEPCLNIIKKLKDKYPIYYITGNHEESNDLWEDKLRPQLKELGVKLLKNKTLKYNNELFITGVDDPVFFKKRGSFKGTLQKLSDKIDEDKFNLLLSHRPEYFDYYQETKFDLILSGHAHGGQWRIPLFLNNGIFSPGQGLLPQYTNGLHTKNNTNLIVSRGLGNSRFPLRLFNYPELIVIDLKAKR